MPRPAKLHSMNATDAKNRFGELLEKVAGNEPVSLMKHGRPAAYVVPPSMYELIAHRLRAGDSAVDRLEREFDDLLVHMQAPASVAAVDSLMTVATTDLRRIVRESPRRRGRHAR